MKSSSTLDMISSSSTHKVAEQYYHFIDITTTLPTGIQTAYANSTLLYTEAAAFRENKIRFNESEHQLKNHVRPLSNRMKEEAKLQYFPSLPGETR